MKIVMRCGCIDGVVLLLGWILSVHLVASPAAGAYCTIPPESLKGRCPALSQPDFLTALFWRNTVAASWSCSAVCHAPWIAHDELSLRLEMEGWLRANRTVGMFPEAYAFVWDELMRLTNHLQGNVQDPRHEMSVYARRANATLKDMPWLLVTNDTLMKAHQFYHQYVRRRPILRVLHLSEDAGEPARIRAYLLDVMGWWAEAEHRISREPRAPVPFLPWVSLNQLIGPELPSENLVDVFNGGNTSIKRQSSSGLRRRSFTFFPPRLPLPTALVYYYTEDCAACEVFGAAFDLLPLMYRRLCEYGHHFIVSCSPLVLFFRAAAGPSQSSVPTLGIYGVRRQQVPMVSVFVSFLIDVDEFFNPENFFEGFKIPLGTHTSIVETLVEVLQHLAMWGILQPRYLSPAEIAEMDQLEYEREVREKQAHASSTNVTTTATPKMREQWKGAAKRRGRVVSLEDHLRGVLTFHLKKLQGENATDIEGLNLLTWSQLQPLWLKVVCVVLSILWFALLRWPPDTTTIRGRWSGGE